MLTTACPDLDLNGSNAPLIGQVPLPREPTAPPPSGQFAASRDRIRPAQPIDPLLLGSLLPWKFSSFREPAVSPICSRRCRSSSIATSTCRVRVFGVEFDGLSARPKVTGSNHVGRAEKLSSPLEATREAGLEQRAGHRHVGLTEKGCRQITRPPARSVLRSAQSGRAGEGRDALHSG